MIKKLLASILLFTAFCTLPSQAAQPYNITDFNADRSDTKTPKRAFWKSNRINLFYQTKGYKGLSDKYKDFSVGILEIKDERISKFYHKKDNFFQTKLLPTLQLFIEQELNEAKMFKEVKMIYEPFDGFLTPEKMEFIEEAYDVDMLLVVNLTDFQLERSPGAFQLERIQKNDYEVSPVYMQGMENEFKIGGVFQLVFLPEQYVLWSDTLDRSFIKYAQNGRLKNKEVMEPIIQNLLSFLMTDMLYLMSEDGKEIRVKG